jgi:hypothetical protein
MQRQRFQHVAPLVKSHFAQCGIANRATIVQHAFKVEAFGSGRSNRFAIHGIVKQLAIAIAGNPLAVDIVLQFVHCVQSLRRQIYRVRAGLFCFYGFCKMRLNSLLTVSCLVVG